MADSVKQRIMTILNRLLGLQKEREEINRQAKKIAQELTEELDKKQLSSIQDHINSL